MFVLSNLVYFYFCVGSILSSSSDTSDRHTRNTKQEKYENILETVLLPFNASHHSEINQFIFQQDGCGPHRAKSIKAQMDAKQINRMERSAQSLGLNQIENAWALLKRRILERSN